MPVTGIGVTAENPLTHIDKWKKETNEEIYEKLGLGIKKKEPGAGKKEVDSFDGLLSLFLAEMKCQNPLNPQDGSDMCAKTAQMASVGEQKKMSNEMRDMTNIIKDSKRLTATSLLDREVEVSTNKMELKSIKDGEKYTANVVRGKIHIPEIPEGTAIKAMKTIITNVKTGEVVEEVNEKNMPVSGRDLDFVWDGTDKQGKRLKSRGKDIEDGIYTVHSMMLAGNDWFNLNTTINTRIESISMEDGGKIMVSAPTLGKLDLATINTFRNGRLSLSSMED